MIKNICSTAGIALSLAVSTPSIAKEKSVKKKAEMPVESPSGGSAGKRARSKAWVAAGYGDIMGGISGYNVEAAAELGAELQVGGGIGGGSLDLGTKSDTTDVRITNDKADAKLFFAKGRYFFGNSFNVAGVLSYRIINASADIAATDGSGELDIQLRSSSITLGVTIGNHWAFDNGLTLGADWVGYHQPLTSSAESSTTTKGILTQVETNFSDDVQKAGESIGKTAHAQLLVATVGFLF